METETNLPALVNVDPVNDMACAVADLDTPIDRVAEILNAVDRAKQAIREADQRITASMIDRVNASGGEVVIGTVRYYVGHPPKTKCVDIKAAIDGIFNACEGDLDRAVEAFASEPIKHGYCKTLLPAELYERCFVTTRGETLEEGKVKAPKLIKMDERFRK